MNFTRYLSPAQRRALEFEVISTDLRVHLTRLLRPTGHDSEEPELALIQTNRLINMARTIMGGKIYRLESDDWGHYHSAEHAWHYGEYELLFRRLSTIQFVEFLGELIESDYLQVRFVNSLLEEDGLSFRYEKNRDGKVAVNVLPLDQLGEINQDRPSWSQNIRLLVDRMENAMSSQDYGALLHASASVFETLAKEVVDIPGVQNQTLGGFFERYRRDSSLPSTILDYILELYTRRNSTPLAGHGSTSPPPTLTEQQAITLVEMTKSFVRIEYRIKIEGATVPRGGGSSGKTNSVPAGGSGAGSSSPSSGATSGT